MSERPVLGQVRLIRHGGGGSLVVLQAVAYIAYGERQFGQILGEKRTLEGDAKERAAEEARIVFEAYRDLHGLLCDLRVGGVTSQTSRRAVARDGFAAAVVDGWVTQGASWSARYVDGMTPWFAERLREGDARRMLRTGRIEMFRALQEHRPDALTPAGIATFMANAEEEARVEALAALGDRAEDGRTEGRRPR